MPYPPHSRILTTAQLHWDRDTPVNEQFADVYFSRDNGAAETDYVFLQQNRLPERWHNPQLHQFTIAETGFGTGLNFLCAAALWQQAKASGRLPAAAHLHFVSTERFPLAREDLAHSLDLRPQPDWLQQGLLHQYPAPVRGNHQLLFPEAGITLSLWLEDAVTALSALDGRVDAWFLDGFAPARNPELWQPALFQAVGQLSVTGTTVASFTAAGLVRRGLQAVGFSLEKVPGFGTKREMLRGVYRPDPATRRLSWPPQDKPWFRCAPAATAPGPVAVVGAGLAGANVARSLAQRGWSVSVFERHDVIASGGSGNPTGITFTKLSVHDTPQNRFYQAAYLHACRRLRQLLVDAGIAPGEDWDFNGVLRLAFDAKEAQAQAELSAQQYWPDELLEPLTAAQIQQRLGLETTLDGVLLKGGGWVNPARLCSALLDHPRIQVFTGAAVGQLQRRKDHWWLDDRGPFTAVVLANALACRQFDQTRHLPLKPVRGQVTYVPASAASRHLRHAINYRGYINPAREGFHCVGATFNPRLTDPELRAGDHRWNWDQLQATLPALARQLQPPTAEQCAGRVGFRCQTPDYLPVIGPAPDIARYHADYQDLSKGFLKREFPVGPNLPGLFVSCAHGSRGITSGCLAAEIVASYLTGEPQAVDREVLGALHPARFLIRRLIRGQAAPPEEEHQA